MHATVLLDRNGVPRPSTFITTNPSSANACGIDERNSSGRESVNDTAGVIPRCGPG